MSTATAPEPLAAVVGIVEDSDEDFGAIARILERNAPATKVERWPTAEGLLDRLEAGEILPWPTLLFIDLNLPGVDGAELVRRLRNHPDTRGMPLYVLSGSARRSDIERCYEAGASVFLQKPLRREDLLAVLQLTTAVRTAT